MPHPILIRPLTAEDGSLLEEALYQAIFVPPGQPLPPREIIHNPSLSCYIDGWGRPGDLGCVAVLEPTLEPIGVAWLRCWSLEAHGYGFIAPDIPELSIAVFPGQRSLGVGTALLETLLEQADACFPATSLSVSADNPAVRLYERFGFEVVSAKEGSLVMQRTAVRFRSIPA